MKTCPRCKQKKELSEFPVVNKKTGKVIYCSDCKKEYDRDYWNRVKGDKGIIKQKQQTINRHRNRLYVINILKQSTCNDCGNKDWRVLEFDHKDRKTKEFNLADCSSYSTERIQQEVNKCDVVCANCHRIRTITQRGYYKYENVV